MDANQAITLLEENGLSLKEWFKLYRILDIRIGLILASDVGADMYEREPELFALPKVRAQTDENGYEGDIVLPWEDGYAGLKGWDSPVMQRRYFEQKKKRDRVSSFVKSLKKIPGD